MSELLPLFLNVTGRRVVLVGGGAVAASKLRQLLVVHADVHVIAPAIHPDVRGAGVPIAQRAFAPADLDGAWLAVAAATPAVNRQVAAAAERRQVFVNAVDDPSNASAFLAGVVRRDGVTLAISTSGAAPALTSLLREGLSALLPRDLDAWMQAARELRPEWRRTGVPMEKRKPLLLGALNALYCGPAALGRAEGDEGPHGDRANGGPREGSDDDVRERGTAVWVPWLAAPEDSWL